jgi:hypothetical protein
LSNYFSSDQENLAETNPALAVLTEEIEMIIAAPTEAAVEENPDPPLLMLLPTSGSPEGRGSLLTST